MTGSAIIAPARCAPAGLALADFREGQVGIPALGIIGNAAVREAFEGDLRQLEELLRGAIKAKLEKPGQDPWWLSVQALFDTTIVIEDKDGRLLRYPYSVDGTAVTLGEPEEVLKTFAPVDSNQLMTEAAHDIDAVFLEAGDQTGSAYRIRVIRAGRSGNNNYYPDDVLKAALPLFEAARVFVKSDEEHIQGRGTDVRNLIGQLTDVEFVEGVSVDTGEIRATLKILQPDGDVAVKLREAWDRKMTGLFGFSIDAVAVAVATSRGGHPVREARKFVKVRSVDLIVQPGAGGGVIDLIESVKETQVMNREQLIALLEAQGLLKGKNTDELSDAQLQQILTEALAASNSNGDSTMTEAVGAPADLREAVRMVEARSRMRTRIANAKLPQQAKTRLEAEFENAASFTEADVDNRIKDEAEYLASMSESGAVRGHGDDLRVESGESRAEKIETMFEAFFDPEHKDHRHARSFRECYIQITGDRGMTGRLDNCDQALMRESLNAASFADVLGDSIRRRMLADYRRPNQYDIWRNLTGAPVPISDFRTNERTRWGGYGDLPAVAEGNAYAALASPTDEKASYAISKKGGTEDITLEMIANDDGVSILSSAVSVTAGAVAEATIDTTKDSIADESLLTIDLTIGGTTPTWDGIDVLLTLIRN